MIRMTLDDRLRSLRDAIQVDVGNRGLARDPADNLFTAFPDDLANACRSITSHPAPRIGIVTGFMIPTVDPPTGETDGPPGALFLAEALAQFGIPCVLMSDASGHGALRAGAKQLPPAARTAVIELPMNFDLAAIPPQPLTHLIAIERSGPSYDGHNFTMRGRDITALTAPAHLLFEGPRDYVTIGIGDGGNEIGMGKIAHSTICKNIPNGELTACRVATDHLIVAGVSNWGAWALAAGVMLMQGFVEPTLFEADLELMLLEHLVQHGPLVDGVTGKNTATVDGLSFDEYSKPLVRIGQIVRG